ncbi:STAS domain-containing protein [Agathobaculum sp. LCP25S3_E8]|uniref:STAS domain-containing protein n=1 Tax=Agathobaculum sp. LCP25S3_E8 TaxID=3438735 RepID=UPI003F8F66F8
MTIQTSRDDTTTTLKIEGRVDTMTSPQLQQAVLEAFQGGEKVVLDFEKVTYISSAGLRVLLIGQKTAQSKHMSMVLNHVGETVKNVLDMVGFSSVMTIE